MEKTTDKDSVDALLKQWRISAGSRMLFSTKGLGGTAAGAGRSFALGTIGACACDGWRAMECG